MRVSKFCLAVVSSALLLSFNACQSSSSSSTTSIQNNLKHRNLPNRDNSYTNLYSAQRMIERGEFSQALPKLLVIVESGNESVPEVHYLLGIVYQELGSPQNALSHYIKYLQVAPTGIYSENSRKKIRELLGNIDTQIEKVSTVEERIASLEERLKTSPTDKNTLTELANWHWLNQNYTRAGELYKQSVTLYPELWNDDTIASRIEKDSEGNIIVLSPDEALRREAERKPIVFFNVTSFRSGRQFGWASDLRHQIYNVSGQVRNRSSRTIKNVSVQVTIYGFSGMVYDTKTINLGHLSPSQTKPFSIQFTNFDNIENVDHYDYVAYYDE
ncbi:MAG: FxLYD domain-containing protein [Candidatus Hydrogenedentes bacterium]|nr:FxLYD domain-containing protein [Candidatus Hydrogenedentota bacterium]